MKLSRIAAAAFATTALLPVHVSAQDQEISNDQRNWAVTRAKLDSALSRVSESITLTAAAIGNSFSSSTDDGVAVETFQETWASTRAGLSLVATDTVGPLNVTAASLANSASIEIAAAGDEDLHASFLANNQVTHSGVVNSTINIEGTNVEAATTDELAGIITSAAIGNSLSAAAGGSFTGLNDQYFGAGAVSNLHVKLDDTRGDLQLTSAAIGNSATFDSAESTTTHIESRQFSHDDPRAYSSLTVNDIEGSLTSTTASMSNSLSVTTLPATAALDVSNTQENHGKTDVFVAISLGNITGDASITAASVGNSAVIENLPAGGF